MDAGFATFLVSLAAAGAALVAAIAAIAACAQVKVLKSRDDTEAALADLREDLAGKIEESARLSQALVKERCDTLDAALSADNRRLEEKFDASRRESAETMRKNNEATGAELERMRGIVGEKLTQRLAEQSRELRDHLDKFDGRFAGFSKQIQGFQEQMTKGLGDVQNTVGTQLKDIREDNGRQLEKMRETVDEKLSKTLNERLNSSFTRVSEQLEAVHKGLGEMKSVAQDVGGLKRVLSNVKTRGVLGEVQLGAILREILTPSQYDENVATRPDSRERVEFAVKIPVEDGFIYLPIDAKFPGDAYDQLQVALETGDRAAVDAACKTLERRIEGEAKDISSKYISVPQTTNFAIMFLPFEGLYAEVVSRPGLIERLQRDYKVNVAGPSTMAAILNSLQMSYQTLALQKRADEIAQILSAVKAEFPKYQKELDRALKQINTAGKTVEGIITTRTRVISRKLDGVADMQDPQAAERLLGIDDGVDAGVGDGPIPTDAVVDDA